MTVNTVKVATTVATAAKYVSLMIGTAIFTIAIATALGGAQRDLSERVDNNAEVTKSGVAAITCILEIEPEDRSERFINECLEANGYVDVHAPTFTP